MTYKIQFKEKGQKRYYNLSHRKLKSYEEAEKMKSMAEKDFPTRKFKIKKK